ncbi:MAG: hypothetical protein GY798_01700 [Hyphomicrobiales bacterium]|nr:hypothetical protein [Hyphomicrobiales bacterium]
MANDAKPILLLDVDGVLAPVVEDAAPRGFTRHEITASTGKVHQVWLNPDHGVWLSELRLRFELVWATGWERDAPRLLGPLLGLPPMDVIVFTQRPQLGTPLRKLQDVVARVGDTPVAWIDDDLDGEAHSWATSRKAPTLLLEPHSAIGLNRDHVRQLAAFSELLSAQKN